jgi:hypothetical protein
MPSVRLTSRRFRDWRTHAVKGGPMILKKHAARTLSCGMWHHRGNESADRLFNGLEKPQNLKSISVLEEATRKFYR